MIEKKTTFVVGAGASYELGLPLGEGLKQLLLPLLDLRFDDFGQYSGKDRSIFNAMLEYQEQEPSLNFSDLVHRGKQLAQALPAAISIDNLLDAHRDDRHMAFIGKLAITKAILQAERASRLFWNREKERDFDLSRASGSWLIPLFQKLTENVPKANVRRIFDNVSFIIQLRSLSRILFAESSRGLLRDLRE